MNLFYSFCCILIALIILSACAALADQALPDQPSPGVTLTQPVPTATGLPEWAQYQSDALRLAFRYPSGWTFREADPTLGEKYAGTDGHFRTGAMSGGGMTLNEEAESEANHVLRPFGSQPMIESLQIHGQPARLILPSDDQPEIVPGEADWGELLVQYPRPVMLQGSLADYFVLYADLDHLRELAATLSFMDQPGRFPAVSSEPAAGICAEPVDPIVSLSVSPDMPDPRCVKVTPGQVLSVTNRTDSPLMLKLAWYDFQLDVDETVDLNVPLGAYLTPGVHRLELDHGSGPEIWLVAQNTP